MASPKPISIKEARVIETLVEQGVITVSVGGGGIPVVETATGLEGREAVIDKDFASEKLAEIIDADLLIVLTGVDNVYVNYQKPDQKKLETVSVSEMKQYIEDTVTWTKCQRFDVIVIRGPFRLKQVKYCLHLILGSDGTDVIQICPNKPLAIHMNIIMTVSLQ